MRGFFSFPLFGRLRAGFSFPLGSSQRPRAAPAPKRAFLEGSTRFQRLAFLESITLDTIMPDGRTFRDWWNQPGQLWLTNPNDPNGTRIMPDGQPRHEWGMDEIQAFGQAIAALEREGVLPPKRDASGRTMPKPRDFLKGVDRVTFLKNITLDTLMPDGRSFRDWWNVPGQPWLRSPGRDEIMPDGQPFWLWGNDEIVALGKAVGALERQGVLPPPRE